MVGFACVATRQQTGEVAKKQHFFALHKNILIFLAICYFLRHNSHNFLSLERLIRIQNLMLQMKGREIECVFITH